ncbi:uncharacterized protein LOC113234334 [Hyposmocoma kahamanoa]|uniref:uncharacterized protein LOC113234334 n=1 Tax=Hyposmocoma kahamanoa TaxID=1477025 RepID=UPI000E6DA3E7|nr:uncharacterized protein LOC113234334 [Hyposmocoma kahamanoa]
MRVEIPNTKRCCFCFPSRQGLLVFAYFRLIVLSLRALMTAYGIWVLSGDYMRSLSWTAYAIEVVFIVEEVLFAALNVLLSLALIAAVHSKSFAIFGPYYRCELIGLFVNVVLVVVGVAMYVAALFAHELPIAYAWFILVENFPSVLYLVLQVHILSLSKNEIFKLSTNQGFRFVNHAAAGEQCTYFGDVRAARASADDARDSLALHGTDV